VNIVREQRVMDREGEEIDIRAETNIVIRKEPKEIEKVFLLLSFLKIKVMFRLALSGRKMT
jgi:hypothetical protein